MPNLFASQPTLDENFPRVKSLWKCPYSGLQVPKNPDANLAWRASMLEAAETDEDLQVDLYTACSQSLLFFVNAFCFTLRVFEPGADGEVKQAADKHIPYVTWEIQDKHLLKLESAIDDGTSLLTDKSRDMGATWDHIVVLIHRFLFRQHESHLMISRKEDAVDVLDGLPKNYPFGALADPGTLFGKIDYVLSRLPEWMLPAMTRKKMHLVNASNGSRIDGESANANAGSSDRRTSIFLDEMAKMEEGEAIKRSTADVTATRLVCSTPNGAGTAYSKWRLSGQIPVFILAWWEHPEKGAGRYFRQDQLGRFQIRSPWYDAECEKRTPKEMAVEIDMDHIGSGDLFFETNVIDEHKKLFAKPPLRKMTVNFEKKMGDPAIVDAIRRRDVRAVKMSPKGNLLVWCSLLGGRPDQTRTYTIGVDISKGQGASNSTVSVMCDQTRVKIAALADANIVPHELAKLVCAIALWVGGRSRPLIIWENNGDPGFDFGRTLVQVYEYPRIWFDKVPGTMAEKAGKRYGWRSNREKKAICLGMLRRAYSRGLFINHDEKALDECLSYVHFEDGSLGPAELQEESEAARATHGDRVIADMLCIVGRDEMPKDRGETAATPARTFAHRFRQWKENKKAAKAGTKFNFATEQ